MQTTYCKVNSWIDDNLDTLYQAFIKSKGKSQVIKMDECKKMGNLISTDITKDPKYKYLKSLSDSDQKLYF